MEQTNIDISEWDQVKTCPVAVYKSAPSTNLILDNANAFTPSQLVTYGAMNETSQSDSDSNINGDMDTSSNDSNNTDDIASAISSQDMLGIPSPDTPKGEWWPGVNRGEGSVISNHYLYPNEDSSEGDGDRNRSFRNRRFRTYINNNSTATEVQQQRFGHSKNLTWTNSINADDYRMGLWSIAFCVIAAVIGWLILLAIFWNLHKMGKCQRQAQRIKKSRNNRSSSSKSSQDSTKVNIENDYYDEEKDQENIDDDKVVLMDFASAATPRWLSFPEQLKPVQSSFTSKSLGSLASSTGDDSSNSQCYQVGVVRNGKLDVLSSSNNKKQPPPSTRRTNQESSSNSFGEQNNQQMIQKINPWNELLGGLVTDLIGCEDNIQGVSFVTNSFSSNPLLAHLAQSAVKKSKTVGDTDMDILRDLKQLEQQVNDQHKAVSAPKELADLQELELTRIASGLSGSNLCNQKENSTVNNNTSSTISSLLTNAMKQKQQGDLLHQEGAQIWYNAQTKTFFQKTKEQSKGNATTGDDQAEYRCVKGETSLRLQRSISLGRNNSSSKRGYRSINKDSDVFFPIPEKNKSGKPNNSDDDYYNDYIEASSAKQRFFHRLGSIIFWISGIGIVASSFSVSIWGANQMHQASLQASDVLGDTQRLVSEGIEIVNGFLEAYNSSSSILKQEKLASNSPGSSVFPSQTINGSNNTSSSRSDTIAVDSMSGVFNDLTQKLDNSANAACDFGNLGGNNKDLLLEVALEEVVGLWKHFESVVLDKLEGLQSDLSLTSKSVISLENNWVKPFNGVVVSLRLGNVLLGIITGLMLLGTAYHKLESRCFRWIILPIFTLLVFLSLIACLYFVMGSLALKDFCGDNPDENVLEFLAFAKPDKWDGEQDAWSILSYEMATDYVLQCPSRGLEEIPGEAATLIKQGWTFNRVLWEVSGMLMEEGTCVVENDIGSVAEMGELIRNTSCNFSMVLASFVNLFRCDIWYELYEDAMQNAVCDSGQTGFLWGTITQSLIVTLSLVMLTVRLFGWTLSCNDDEGLAPELRGRGNNREQDATLLIEDDEEDVSLEVNSDNFDDLYPALAPPVSLSDDNSYDNSSSMAMIENHPITLATKQRQTRNLRKGNKDNYLASTSLYSMGAGYFETRFLGPTDNDTNIGHLDDGNSTSNENDDSHTSNGHIDICLSPNTMLSRIKEHQAKRQEQIDEAEQQLERVKQQWAEYSSSNKDSHKNNYSSPDRASSVQGSKRWNRSPNSSWISSSSSGGTSASSLDDFGGKKETSYEGQHPNPRAIVTVTTQ